MQQNNLFPLIPKKIKEVEKRFAFKFCEKKVVKDEKHC